MKGINHQHAASNIETAHRRSRSRIAAAAATLALGLVLVGCSSESNGGQQTGFVSTGGTAATPITTSGGGSSGAGTGGTTSSSGGVVQAANGGTTPSGAGGAGAAAGQGSGGTLGAGGASGASGASTAGAAGATAGGAAGASGAAGGGAGGATTCTPMGMAGSDPCTASLEPNDDRQCKFMYNGAQRQFWVYASPAFDPCKPASLIMDCHGLSETAEVQAGKDAFVLNGQKFPNGYGSSWRMAVQKDNAIVITPQGVGNSWSPATDVGYVNKAADMVEAIANVDKERVYVTGISMGGQMTVATGCDNAARWRGMAPVSMLSQGCSKLAKPTPVISFHAMTDQLTSYPADQSLMQTIAGLNHCKTGPTKADQYGGAMTSTDPVCFVNPNGIGSPDAADPLHIPLQTCQVGKPTSSCVSWTDCDDGVEVKFCTVVASTQPLGGHILYNNDTQLDLSEVAWRFFKKFQK